MKNKLKFFAKVGCFLVVIVMVLSFVNVVLVPKVFSEPWHTAATFNGFYKMEKNTIDVLFMGSSHTMTSISPQYIYNEYELKTYNLGSEQQNLIVTYYWLKEALKYQNPKVVVLDTLYCFEIDKTEPLNASESVTRKSIDAMKWSKNKFDAIQTICEYDENQTTFSYYFPNIRFHERWDQLNEYDFNHEREEKYHLLKGYTMLTSNNYPFEYAPFWGGDVTKSEEMHPLMEEYLLKIIQLCKENNIELVLMKTPASQANVGKYITTKALAEEYDIAYYDFNEIGMYKDLNYDVVSDNNDNGHANHWGAEKISDKMAQILMADFDINPSYDEQWEESKEHYNHVVENANLRYVDDIYKYLQAIDKEEYTVFMSVKDDSSLAFDEEILEGFQGLGLSQDLAGNFGASYYAVITQDTVIEEFQKDKKISIDGAFREQLSFYSITSGGAYTGSVASIKIDGVECAKNQTGLNIVVYDNVTGTIVDSVCFETHDAALTAIR